MTVSVYLQVGDHQFINFDDGLYVTENQHVAAGLTGPNIVWAVTTFETGNWHPLAWLSHMADVQLFGMNPRGHHLTSVAIHTISALLLFLFLVRVTGGTWQSAFVAALFALHPLHVESVAWVSERKDVLSAFFCFLTLIAYAEFTATRKISWYAFSLFLFILGLMSKPMLVTLPVLMILLDYWPLGRFQKEKQQAGLRHLSGCVLTLVKEKIPFFVCALFSGLVTISAQHQEGAISALSVVPFWLRGENALIAYVTYIVKTLWPHDLAILYPFPRSIPLWQAAGSLFILCLVTTAVIRAGRRSPYLLSGWFWFIITLVPVIGLMQVGSQSMADRYSYIPLIGLFIMAAWGVADLTKNWRQRQAILAALAGTVIIASAVATWRQAGYWRDNITLYRNTLNVTSGNYSIHNNLGIALAETGQLNAAIREYQNALRIFPEHANAHHNLGTALQTSGFLDPAIHEYRESLRIAPNNADARMNLGRIFTGQGRLDEAIREYRETLRIDPNNTNARFSLKVVFAQKIKQDEARK